VELSWRLTVDASVQAYKHVKREIEARKLERLRKPPEETD
jgi:hypothetical protein